MIPILLTVVIILCYLKFIKPLHYWKNRGIPYFKSWPILGFTGPIFFKTKHIGCVFQDIYMQFPNNRYVGIYFFSTPALMIRDLDLVKKIFITDFDKFTDHAVSIPEAVDDFVAKSVFLTKGKHWKETRSLLNQTFTNIKIKGMFPSMVKNAENLVEYYRAQTHTLNVDIAHIMSLVMNDVLASCFLGIECDSFKPNNNEFHEHAKKYFHFRGFNMLKIFGSQIIPSLMKFLKIKLMNESTRRFYQKIVDETIEHQRMTGLIRSNIIQLLNEAQRETLVQNEHTENAKISPMSNEDITIQLLTFIFAGYDTVVAVLCSMAYELAVNFDFQEQLIEEVDNTLKQCNGKLDYAAIVEMKYLDMVVLETLRLWPPSGYLSRKSVKPYTIHPSRQGEIPLHLEIGTACVVSILGIHNDPQYFPNPQKFNPQRFEDKKANDVKNLLAFGIGPRVCIGKRFALLEIKIIFALLLSKFNILPNDKTAIPPIIDKNNMSSSKKQYWVELKPRDVKFQQ